MPATKEIVGIKPYDFVDAKTRERVEGYTIYLQWEETEIAGVGCEAIGMKLQKLADYDPALGDHVVVSYNKYGKADWIMPVDRPKMPPAPPKQGG